MARSPSSVTSLGIGLVVASFIDHAERHPSQAVPVLIMINSESRRGSDHG
jgi:hypothetical protein